jgi:lysozyme
MTLEDAETFVQAVKEATGRWPTLYSGQSFLAERLKGKSYKDTPIGNCPLWIARYNSTSPVSPKGFRPWSLWQFTSAGRCPGVVGDVDRSKFAGTVDALPHWWSSAGR